MPEKSAEMSHQSASLPNAERQLGQPSYVPWSLPAVVALVWR